MLRYYRIQRFTDPLSFVLECLRVGGLELHLGPHRLDVGLAEDDQCPAAGLHRLDDLVRDHLADGPVPGVDAALVLHGVRALLGGLQAGTEGPLHPVLVLVGVGEEHVVRLVLVNQVLREENTEVRLGVHPDSKMLPGSNRIR